MLFLFQNKVKEFFMEFAVLSVFLTILGSKQAKMKNFFSSFIFRKYFENFLKKGMTI